MAGDLTVIVGPMGSGKTLTLFKLFSQYKRAKYEYVLFKNRVDNRDTADSCTSRAGISRPAISIESVLDIDQALYDDSVDRIIAFEEGQFFRDDLVPFVRMLLRETEHKIVVTGLATDFRHEPFGVMPQLMAMADTLIPLTGVCDICQGPATRTQRLVDGKPAPLSSPLILVGGDEAYTCRCPDHYVYPT